jgi:Ca-activated chloride channel family protein
LKPTRIESAKKILKKFIKNLKTDRVWLVVFAWKPLSSVPLTFDYNILWETLDNLTTDSLNQNIPWLNWTAVWDAILIAKKLFKAPVFSEEKEKKNREKVIIVLTDWDSNKWINPILVAKILKKEKIKIYTIWIGSKSGGILKFKIWPLVQTTRIPPLNEKTLREISKISSWEFFRATDNKSFEKIFENLKKLEKQDIEVKILKNKKEYYKPFYIILIILIFLLFLVENRKY